MLLHSESETSEIATDDEQNYEEDFARITPNIIEQDDTIEKEDTFIEQGTQMPTDSSIMQAVHTEEDFVEEADMISGHDFLGDEKESYSKEWSHSKIEFASLYYLMTHTHRKSPIARHA